MREPVGPFRGTRVEKPWGYELIWARADRYVGKILHVQAGEALSLQYHERKDETLYLLSGEVRMEIGDAGETLTSITLRPGDSLHIPPHRRHRLHAVVTSDVLEASTPELDDVVRLEDRYGRTK
jgi:mannose-6-phosphate isomerase-like protein (cupin superfamily)